MTQHQVTLYEVFEQKGDDWQVLPGLHEDVEAARRAAHLNLPIDLSRADWEDQPGHPAVQCWVPSEGGYGVFLIPIYIPDDTRYL